MSLTGDRNGRWRGGATRTWKGYVRITAGPDRHKYEHRVKADACVQEWNPFGWWGGLPAGVQVHHLDWREDHNCTTNLLILPREIHDVMTRDSQRFYRAMVAAGLVNAPGWVTGEAA